MISLEKTDAFSDAMKCVGCFIEYDGHVLFLLRAKEKSEAGRYGIPGGKVDVVDNGDPIAAIIREVFEETGIIINPESLQPAGIFYVDYENGNKIIYDTFRYVLSEKPEIILQAKEHQGYAWATPENAIQLPLMIHGDYTIKHVYKLG